MWKLVLLLGLIVSGCQFEAESTTNLQETLQSSSVFTQKAEKLYNTDDLENCLHLEVSESEVLTVIAQSKNVEGPEWHNNHVYPPCRFTGKVLYDDKILSYAYYPTGYLSLEGYENWFMCYECTVHAEWLEFDNRGQDSE